MQKGSLKFCDNYLQQRFSNACEYCSARYANAFTCHADSAIENENKTPIDQFPETKGIVYAIDPRYTGDPVEGRKAIMLLTELQRI